MEKLAATELACVRNRMLVFENLSFAVQAGEGMILTGPNGSGKSSLLRMSAGLLEPARGTIRYEGKGGINWLDNNIPLKPDLSARENLAFWARITGAPASAVTNALARLGMDKHAGIRLRHMSAGQRQRVNLCRLLLAPASLWLLDEPTTALDEKSAALLKTLVDEQIRQGGLALIASHQPEFWPGYKVMTMRGHA